MKTLLTTLVLGFIFSFLIAPKLFATKTETQSFKVSATIPLIIGVNDHHLKEAQVAAVDTKSILLEDPLMEERIREGERVIIKTLVAR